MHFFLVCFVTRSTLSSQDTPDSFFWTRFAENGFIPYTPLAVR